MTPLPADALPDLGRLATLLAVAAAVPVVAWLLFERLAAFLARIITMLTGRRDPVVAAVRGGSEGMVGLVGVVRRPLDPRGKVFVRGELWDAVADEPVPSGDGCGDDPDGDPAAAAARFAAGRRVEVCGLDGLTLRVAPAAGPDPGSDPGSDPDSDPGADPDAAPGSTAATAPAGSPPATARREAASPAGGAAARRSATPLSRIHPPKTYEETTACPR